MTSAILHSLVSKSTLYRPIHTTEKQPRDQTVPWRIFVVDIGEGRGRRRYTVTISSMRAPQIFDF